MRRPEDERRRHPVAAVADSAGRLGSLLWRSLFLTAAGLCVVAGVLHALGRTSEAYGCVLVAGALGAGASLFGLLSLRVETGPDPYDPIDHDPIDPVPGTSEPAIPYLEKTS